MCDACNSHTINGIINKRKIIIVILNIILFLDLLLFLSIRWMTQTWLDLSVDEVLFHLINPLAGTNSDMVKEYFFSCVILCIVLFILYSFIQIYILKEYKKAIFVILPLLIISLLGCSVYLLENKMGLCSYIRKQSIYSKMIEKNYLDPIEVDITFPENKRNLIYIYLESMEITYADSQNGGAYKENYIPELTELARENECFSDGDKLNGAYSLYGTTWTMGGMFAESTGLPLKANIYNNMNKQDDFFSNIVAIGDILKEEGYNNELMVGSDVEFGGREKFYRTHGDYFCFDYIYAKNAHYIPENYHEFWGFEDEKLFEYAKQELKRLSKTEEPFNLTLLTVDTHFEDGYVCRLCDKKYGDNQYANVISCSSRQVYNFVEWIKEQDFYDNTTIVISGDHPTMDVDFCNSIDDDYQRRVYTTFINSTKTPGDKGYRMYSTFDFFPTTISALGAEIAGSRLGLGVDLFSEEESLVERYGYDKCMDELSRKSVFYDRLEYVELTDEMIDSIKNESNLSNKDDGEFWDIDVHLAFLVQSLDIYKGLYIRYNGSKDKSQYVEKKVVVLDDSLYDFEYKLNKKDVYGEKLNIQVIMKMDDGNEFKLLSYYDIFESTDIETFLSQIDTKKYSVFISARDEAATNLSTEAMNELHKMGINTQINIDGFRKSYYAIIVDGIITEDLSEDKLESVGGEKKYDLKYDVISEGYNSGNYSSIIINDKEYSMNMRGLNIVLYDNDAKRVVKSVNYDTYLDSSCRMMEVD